MPPDSPRRSRVRGRRGCRPLWRGGQSRGRSDNNSYSPFCRSFRARRRGASAPLRTAHRRNGDAYLPCRGGGNTRRFPRPWAFQSAAASSCRIRTRRCSVRRCVRCYRRLPACRGTARASPLPSYSKTRRPKTRSRNPPTVSCRSGCTTKRGASPRHRASDNGSRSSRPKAARARARALEGPPLHAFARGCRGPAIQGKSGRGQKCPHTARRPLSRRRSRLHRGSVGFRRPGTRTRRSGPHGTVLRVPNRRAACCKSPGSRKG